MADEVKCVQLKRSHSYGFGFSILGGSGSELPPIIYDIIENSPAAVCGELEAGDVILAVNDREVVALTTKEVLKCLRLSSDTVNLKLKRDASIKEKVKIYLHASNDMDTLKKAITREDLDGVKEVIAKKSPTNQGYSSPRTNGTTTTNHNDRDMTHKKFVSGIPRPHPSTSAPGRLETDGVFANKDGGGQHYHSKMVQPRFEAYMMTGDLILNLNAKTSGFTSGVVGGGGSLPSKGKRNEQYGHTTSTPASPEESELRTKGKGTKRELPTNHGFCSPVADKKPAFGYVRTSKSEDHLHPKDSLTTVNIDIDDDDVAASLNTLLDTRHDGAGNAANERIVWTYNAPVAPSGASSTPSSSSDGSQSPSPQLSPTSASSPLRSPTSPSRRRYPPTSPKRKAPPLPVYPKGPHSSPTVNKRSDNKYHRKEDMTNGEVVGSPSSSDEMERLGDFSSELSSPYEERSTQLDSLRDEEWLARLQNRDPFTGSDDDTSVCPLGNHADGRGGTCFSPTDFDSPCLSPVQEMVAEVNAKWDGNVKVGSSPKKRSNNGNQETLLEFGGRRRHDAKSPESTGSGDVSLAETKSCADGSSLPDEEMSQKTTSPPLDDDSDIESIHSFHYSPKAVDMPSASRLAKRLFYLEGFKKSDVSRHLSKNNEFNRVVAEDYLRYFEFTTDTLDIALRKFLKQFSLTGETQERERVLVHFSKRFLDCNPGTFNSQDAVHTLTCALMLLNSDLHGQNIGRKMTCTEFIENLADLNDGENFPKDVLKALYQSIKVQPLEWAMDEEEYEEIALSADVHARRIPDDRSGCIGHNPFLEVPNASTATEYKKGYVMRKCCVEPSGKKTPFGKRGWKMFYATLKDLVLYLHKDEHGFKKNQLYDSLHNSIRIHHSIATKATDYTKKQHVFRLQTADWAEYLFQTSDSKELQSWIDTINFVSASLSAPPLAGAVGSQKKFQRPLLPCSHTKLNLREQLLDHEERVAHLERELEDHRAFGPDKGARSRVVHDFQEKEMYLQYELKRYKTYAYLLRSKMVQHPELEPPLVETPIGEVDEKENENGDQTTTTTTSITTTITSSTTSILTSSTTTTTDTTASTTVLSTSSPVSKTEHVNQQGKRNVSDRYSYRAAIYSGGRGDDYV